MDTFIGGKIDSRLIPLIEWLHLLFFSHKALSFTIGKLLFYIEKNPENKRIWGTPRIMGLEIKKPGKHTGLPLLYSVFVGLNYMCWAHSLVEG
jgi:hypothetical protein